MVERGDPEEARQARPVDRGHRSGPCALRQGEQPGSAGDGEDQGNLVGDASEERLGRHGVHSQEDWTLAVMETSAGGGSVAEADIVHRHARAAPRTREPVQRGEVECVERPHRHWKRREGTLEDEWRIAPDPGPARGLRNPDVRSSCRLRGLRRPGGPASLVSGEGTEPAAASLRSSPSLEFLPRSMELTACAQLS